MNKDVDVFMEAESHVTGGPGQVAGLSDGLRSLCSGSLEGLAETSLVRSCQFRA